MRRRQSFSLTELLVVVAIILVFASLLIVTTGEVYSAAQRIACQQRLMQIDSACRMFSNANRGRELPHLDLIGGASSARWYEKLLPYFNVASVDDAREYLNCPSAQPGEIIGQVGGGRGLGMPVLIYRTSNRANYGTYLGIRDGLRASDRFLGGCDLVHYGDSGEAQLFAPGGLTQYGQFWLFSLSENDVDAFHPSNPSQRDPESIRLFREVYGGGLFMAGDHSGWTASNPEQHYGGWNTSLNAIADHCKLGICLRSARSHNDSVESNGHFIGNGITYLPRGTVPLSVGHVSIDDRVDDERKLRHACVSFPIRCRGHQEAGDDGPVTPAGVHEQPCGVIGVMDDGLGRVCIGSTFTRWGTSYYTQHNQVLSTLAEQIAVWLAGGHGRGGGITYGYNNQIGRTTTGAGLGPSVPEPRRTIRVLDYRFYVADHDGNEADNDDITCIAPRHRGRANVLFADGHVEALTPEEIMAEGGRLWNVWK